MEGFGKPQTLWNKSREREREDVMVLVGEPQKVQIGALVGLGYTTKTTHVESKQILRCSRGAGPLYLLHFGLGMMGR